MDWRTAYLRQALADYKMFQRLIEMDDVPQCHCLHFLQMATEKLAKGLASPMEGSQEIRTHKAFKDFVDTAKSRRDIRRACGFTQWSPYRAYIASLTGIAKQVQDLSPEDEAHPNPEYPWELRGQVFSPLDHSFGDLSLYRKNPKFEKLLTFLKSCMDVAASEI